MTEVRPTTAIGPVTPLPGSRGSQGYLIRRGDNNRSLSEQLNQLYDRWYRTLDLNPAVRLVLRDIHTHTRAPAYFARLREDTMSVVDVVDSIEVPRVAYSAARLRGNGYRSAAGRALLSTLPDVDLVRYMRDHQPDNALSPILDAVRRTGIAHDIGEFVRHIASIAVPTPCSVDDLPGALAVSLPATEYSERRGDVEQVLRDGSQKLVRLLGPM